MRSPVIALVVLASAGCVADTTPPEVLLFTPGDSADLRGVGMLTVKLGLQEDHGTGTAYIDLDGTTIGTQPFGVHCDEGCELEFPGIDTTHVPVGRHTLRAQLVDGSNNATEVFHSVVFDDVVTVHSLEVTNIVDDVPPLEIEVYVFDDATNTLLGCAGSRQGLATVDVSDVHYDVDATLIDPLMKPMAAQELGGGPIRFEVWEDDDPPVCPVALNPLGNDHVGTSPAMTTAAWHGITSIGFGNVVELGVAFDRPLAN
jgi:hypothetical protein